MLVEKKGKDGKDNSGVQPTRKGGDFMGKKMRRFRMDLLEPDGAVTDLQNRIFGDDWGMDTIRRASFLQPNGSGGNGDPRLRNNRVVFTLNDEGEQ